MKELTQEIFIGKDIRVDWAGVDFDGLLHFGKAINPRYTWASERWRGFEKIGEPVENSGFKPLTSIRLNVAKLADETIYNNTHEEEERAEIERSHYYCVHCLAMHAEECVCNENEDE